MDLHSGSKLGSIRRPSCTRLGTKVQKVRDSIIIREVNGGTDHVVVWIWRQ